MLAIHRAILPKAILLITTGVLVAGACKAPRSFGERNSVILYADSALWAQVEDTVRAALERPIFTTRNETEFKITFVAIGDTLWEEFRLWQQVVVLGSDDRPVPDRVVGAADAEEQDPPALVHATDIWAGNQEVTLVLLPESGKAEAVRSQMDELYASLREDFDTWVRQRMYASGVNDSLVDVLSAFGFRLEIPQVYVHGRQDSIFRFRNILPRPTDRIRSLLVTWQSADRFQNSLPSPQELLEWRRTMDETLYDPPQDLVDGSVRFDTVSVGDLQALEMRAAWQDRSDFPAAGPLITRAVPCAGQDRVYLLDAWLYAPKEDKYPFIRQLEILLDSFRCSDEEPVQIAWTGGTAWPTHPRAK